MAIFGPNGAGKTNILEAVSLFSPGRGLRRAGVDEIARTPERLGWKITADLERGDELHELQCRAENGGSRQVEIDGKPATQITLGELVRILWLVPSMDRLWLEGASERRRFLDRIAMSFIPSHATVVLDYEKAMRERNRLLKDQVRDAGWYSAIEAQMGKAAEKLVKNRAEALVQLSAAQDAAETAFPVAELSLKAGEYDPLTPDELPEIWKEGRNRDMAAGRTLAGPHRADLGAVFAAKGVEARLCSTGEQKALLISLVLANARALAADLGIAPILLLDEVAAHLDAERRAALYAEVCSLGSQAWMTGTGAELFTELGERAQMLEVSEKRGLSTVNEVTI